MSAEQVSLADLAVAALKRFEARCDYVKGKHYRVELPLPGVRDLTPRDASTLAQPGAQDFGGAAGRGSVSRVCRAWSNGAASLRNGWTLSLVVHLIAGKRTAKPRRRGPLPARNRVVPVTPWRPGS